MKTTLEAGAKATLELRGDGLFGEDNHHKLLFATMVFSSGDERLVVRKSGRILKTD